MGITDLFGLSKLKSGLSKTRERFSAQLLRVLKGKTSLDDDLLAEIEEMLVVADVGVDMAGKITGRMKSLARERRYINETELQALLKEAVLSFFSEPSKQQESPVISRHAGPHVVLIVGVNGVGKTTTIGKLAFRYRNEGKSVLIAAADTFRAAANEQLEIWAERAGAKLLKQNPGADPAAVAFDALASAMSSGIDLLLIDTAGRLHTRMSLMEELRKIRRVLQKRDAAAPHEVLLVIDASTGQNGLSQARQFKEFVDLTGIVLTKLDGTAKGGIVLAISGELSVPVTFVGLGEGIDDLEPFSPPSYVDALFENLAT